jgi:DNA-binding transcriptional LysR family regulator
MLDPHRLRLLAEFADRGTIAATATALGYTPSAVSQQLAVLEREAGTGLLDRTARSAELTDAGRRLAGHARQILAMMEGAESDLSARAQEPEGRVVVTAFPSAAAAFAPALAHSLRVHPGLTLLMRQSQPGEGPRPVSSGEADIALVDDWSGRLGQPSAGQPGLLQFHRLLRDPLVLVVPRNHPVASQQRIQLRKLRDEAWMVAPAGEPSREAVDRLLAGSGGIPQVSWGSPPCPGWPSPREPAGSPSGICQAPCRPGTCSRWCAPPASAAPRFPWCSPPCAPRPRTCPASAPADQRSGVPASNSQPAPPPATASQRPRQQQRCHIDRVW